MPQKTPPKHKIGTKVRCRGGNPVASMTVVKNEYNEHERANYCTCEWVTDGKTHGESYHEDSLEVLK